jgi:hypothetical protein
MMSPSKINMPSELEKALSISFASVKNLKKHVAQLVLNNLVLGGVA